MVRIQAQRGLNMSIEFDMGIIKETGQRKEWGGEGRLDCTGSLRHKEMCTYHRSIQCDTEVDMANIDCILLEFNLVESALPQRCHHGQWHITSEQHRSSFCQTTCLKPTWSNRMINVGGAGTLELRASLWQSWQVLHKSCIWDGHVSCTLFCVE